MDILEYRDYCLSLPFVEESTPFDETTLVFKVGGRMFTYAGMEDFRRLAVKCDPDEAVGLRERYEGVEAARQQTPLERPLRRPRSERRFRARTDPPLLHARPAA